MQQSHAVSHTIEKYCKCLCFNSVDRLLNPANRMHMSLEEQLKELLEKLDLTCAMKSSGSRSKRAKLLKKEINLIRSKISQQHHQPPQIESGIGSFEEENAVVEHESEEEGKRHLDLNHNSTFRRRRLGGWIEELIYY